MGMLFGGFNGSWKYKPKGHHLYEQEEVQPDVEGIPEGRMSSSRTIRLLAIHERDSDVHQGFRGFKDYIDRTQPRYFIHGHQHLNQVTSIGDTQVIGVFGEAEIELQ